MDRALPCDPRGEGTLTHRCFTLLKDAWGGLWGLVGPIAGARQQIKIGWLGRVLINRSQMRTWMCAAQGPLLELKRTWRGLISMSANDPKRTLRKTQNGMERACSEFAINRYSSG